MEQFVPLFEEHVKTVNEVAGEKHMTVYEIVARDPEQTIKKIVEYIGDNGNTGHSFSIVVDPDYKEKKKEFYWDGDGTDYVHSVKITQEPITEGTEYEQYVIVIGDGIVGNANSYEEAKRKYDALPKDPSGMPSKQVTVWKRIM